MRGGSGKALLIGPSHYAFPEPLLSSPLRLAGELKDYCPGPGPGVKVHEDQLLPCAEERFAIPKRDGKRRLEEGSPEVACAVVIAPCRVVMIVPALRNNRLKEFLQVADHPRLELHRRDPGS